MNATGTMTDRVSGSSSQPESGAVEEALPVRFGELLAGKYRVDQVIGKGGMALVLAGTHVQLDAPIAIKILRSAHAGSADAVKRFLSEARAAARLKSPNVAHISDVGTAPTKDGMLPFIVMERLDGVDLASLMEDRKKLPVAEALDFARQASRGLEEAHGQGIVHRDIKPANLFLTKTREGVPLVKVLDFGISKTIAAIDSTRERAITRDNDALGSPGYMSPEQVKAAKDVDVRTDIWSLGVVLHELISGKPCFDGDELQDIFAAILHGEVPALDDDVPAEVRGIVRRCLQKDPNKRYASAAELTQALTEVGTARQRSRLPLVLGVAAVAIIVGALAFFVRPKPEAEPAAPALSLQNAVAVPVPVSVAPPPPPPPTRSAPPAVSSTSSAPPPPPPPKARPIAVAPPKPTTSAAPPIPTPTPTPEPPPSRQRTDW